MRRCAWALTAALIAVHANGHALAQTSSCSNRLGTIKVPAGFCIDLVADSLNAVRHIAAGPGGQLYAAVGGGRGGLVVLRDRDGDGRFDTRTKLYAAGGNDVVVRDGKTLYYTTNDAVMRIRLLAPDKVAGVDTIVQELAVGGHTTKSIAFDGRGGLYVGIGSLTNSCQQDDRVAGSRGVDPCTELDTRAGIWRFEESTPHQTFAHGSRYATGLRNAVALTSHPITGELYAVQHGRDQLAALWGFTNEQSAELPSEVLVRIAQGDNFGWPYCYHDRFLNRNVLAPEYGGDGRAVGRCASFKAPIAAFPGHWAPMAIAFYNGTQFPAAFRGGAFISFHGSWNREPLPQAGFKVVYQPMADGRTTGAYRVFAEGFDMTHAGPSGKTTLRPLGLAVGPDGSLYVGSDDGGKVWRIRASNAR